MSKNELLEKLAVLEHVQWESWSRLLASNEKISPERVARWKMLWIPYTALDEDQKDFDRHWARLVIDELKLSGVLCDGCKKKL